MNSFRDRIENLEERPKIVQGSLPGEKTGWIQQGRQKHSGQKRSFEEGAADSLRRATSFIWRQMELTVNLEERDSCDSHIMSEQKECKGKAWVWEYELLVSSA